MELVCPGCGRKNDDPKAESFRHYLILSWPKQLAIFALGWAGFQIIASFIQQIYLWSFQTQNPGCTQEDILKYAMSPAFQGPVNFISYGILLGYWLCNYGTRGKGSSPPSSIGRPMLGELVASSLP